MRIFFLGIFLSISFLNVYAQGDKRVKFSSCFTETKLGEGEIIITAKIEKDFHVFSFNPGGDGAQVPTDVSFVKNKDIELVGKPIEKGKLIKENVEVLDIIINYYKNEVKYIQKIKYKKKVKGEAKIYFQVCNDAMCERAMEVIVPFDLNNNCSGTVAVIDTTKKAKAIDSPTTSSTVVIPKDSLSNISNTKDTSSALKSEGEITYGDFGKIVSDCGDSQEKKLSPWLAFLYGLLGGFAALFFPCTLPMIPMTISFFLKGANDRKQGIRNGIIYGFFIFLVYFLLSMPFLFFNWGGSALSNISTNVWVNIAFFIIFIFFAFSLFGFYDISLPSSIANKVDSKSNAKTFGGIFFMALTLAIVSFSCTGPILGLVLGNVDNPGLITPAMSGFGIGLGVPFALFAIFPNLLKALPKSGSWLTTLKVVFGFIELAFALKFLSNADLVKQWGLLKRELFIGLWILVCLVMGLYLIGKFKIKKNDYYKRTLTTDILGILCFVFAGYLSLDFFGKDIGLVSGFPPPKFYSYSYKQEKLQKGTTARTHDLNGLKIYLYLDDAIAEGKKQNKPVMIDFTGWACVNCRKMEENVWPKPEIYSILKDKYIIASLYVDEQISLPTNEMFFSPVLKKQATTVGDKWFDLSVRHFNSASQPFYALIDPVSHRIMNTPRGYTPGVQEYSKFLKCGITNYKLLNP